MYSTGIPVQESLGLGTLRLDPTDKRAKLAMELTATSVASEPVKVVELSQDGRQSLFGRRIQKRKGLNSIGVSQADKSYIFTLVN
jgi:hypothetical protein